jgi:hypothetical protein
MADIINNAEDLDKGEKSSGKGTQKRLMRIKINFLRTSLCAPCIRALEAAK